MTLNLGVYQKALEHIEEDYEYIREIGRGGFGIVLGAYHTMQEEEHAIKIINCSAVPAEEAKYMNREITLLRKCKHKYILRMIHAFKRDKFIYLIMPVCSTDMYKMLQVKCPTNELLNHMIYVCEGVDYLHQKEIVHRDMKPMNVLMLEKGGKLRPQIADFGLAKHANTGTTSQQFGVYGTIEYMPPEWLMPKRSTDRNSCSGDNWAIGVMIYQILHGGSMPFPADMIGYIMSFEYQPIAKEHQSWEPFFKSIFCEMDKRLSATQIMVALDARVNPSPDKPLELPKVRPKSPGQSLQPPKSAAKPTVVEEIAEAVTQKAMPIGGLAKLPEIEEAYPPGKLLIGGYKSKNLIIYDYEKESVTKRIPIDGIVYFISKLKNGYILIGLGSGKLHYFNPKTESIAQTTECRDGSIYDFAELPDDLLAIACGKSEQVEIHNMLQLKLVKELPHSGPTIAAHYWEANKLLVTASIGQNLKLILWDISKWKIVKEYTMSSPVVQIIELKDGRLVLSTEGALQVLTKDKTLDKLSNASPDAELNAYDRCKNLCELQPGVLAYGQKNGTMITYDIKKESKISSFNASRRKITNIKLIGKEQFIQTSYAGLKVFDSKDFEELKIIDIKDQAWDVACYGKGKTVRAKKEVEEKVAEKAVETTSEYPPKNILQGGFNKKLVLRDFESNMVIKEEKVEGNIYVMRQVAENIVACGTAMGKVYIWDIKNQKIMKTIDTSPGRVFDILRLPSNQMAVVCNASNKVEIYDGKYTKIKEINIEGKPIALCLTPTSQIVIGTESGDLRIFNLSWAETSKSEVEGKVVQIINLADGRLAITTRSKKIYIWDLNTGKKVQLSCTTIDAEMGSSTSNKAVSLCELKPGVLIWGEKAYGELTIWDIKSDTKLKSIKNHNRRISTIQIISTSHFIVGTYEHIRVYSLADYSELKCFQCTDDAWDFFTYTPSQLKLPDLKGSVAGESMGVVERAFPPKYLLVGGFSNELFLKDFETGDIIQKVSIEGNTYCMLNLSNGHIAISLSSGKIHIWDTNNNKIWKTAETIKEGRVFQIAELSGNRLAAATGQSNMIEIYEIETMDRITELQHTDATLTVSKIEKDKLVSGGEDKTVIVWDTTSWKSLKKHSFEHAVVQVVGLADGRAAISSYMQTTVYLWDWGKDTLQTLSTQIDAQMGTGTANKTSNMCEIQPGLLVFGYKSSYGKVQVWNLVDNKEECINQVSTRRIATIKKYTDDYILVGTYASVVAAKLTDREVVKTIDCKSQAWDFAAYGHDDASNLDYNQGPGSADLAPNFMIYGGFKEDIIVRDFETKQIVLREKLDGRIYCITDLKNGQAALGLSKGCILIWDLSERKTCMTIQTKGDRVLCIALLEGKKQIAAATGKSKKVEIYDIETWKEVGTLEHAGGVTSIVVLANGNLVSGSEDRTVAVWNPTNWNKIKDKSVEGKVGQLLVLSDGQIAIAVRGKGAICIWNSESGSSQNLPSPGIDAEIGTDTANKATSMCELRPGILAWALRTYGQITIWDIQANQKVTSITTQNKRITKIVVLGKDKMITCSYYHVVIYDMATYKEIHRLDALDDAWDLLPYVSKGGPAVGPASGGMTTDFSVPMMWPPKHLLYGGYDSKLSVIDYGSKKETKSVQMSGPVYKILRLSNGNIAIGSVPKLYMWEPKENKIVQEIIPTEGGKIFDMIELPNKLIAISLGKNMVEVYNMELKKQYELPHDGATISLTLLDNGKVATGCVDGKMRIWDLPSKKCETVKSFDGKEIVQSLALSTGRIAVSTLGDHSIYMWDPIGNTYSTIAAEIDSFMGITTSNKANNMCEIKKGILAYGSSTELGTIIIWDLLKGQRIRTISTNHRRICFIRKIGEDKFIVGTYANIHFYNSTDYSSIETFDLGAQVWEATIY